MICLRILIQYSTLNLALVKVPLLVFFLPLCTPNISSAATSQKTLIVNAIDWCPQICNNHSKPGYIVELVEKIFQESDYKLTISIFPWSRAIRNVSLGRADAILSPAKNEAPHLLYPKMAVGYQQMCFFTLKESSWKYTGVKSLKDVIVGIAKDTSIEELNDYVKEHPHQFQFQPYHERFVTQNLAKLKKKRMDTFLFTKNTTNYMIKSLNQSSNYKIAGCVSSAPLYMAFTPSEDKKIDILKLIAIFDHRLSQLKATSYYKNLLKSYDIVLNE